MEDSETLPTNETTATPAVDVGQQIGRHEKALLQGDLSQLSADERKAFYTEVVESIGLNPMTKPLEYIRLNGDLTLYANKTAAAQLRDRHGISITDLDIHHENGLHVVYATAQDEAGRTDIDEGSVPINNKSGEARANARMKAITKAKRRVTLSICGLGFLDQTEVDDIPDQAKQDVNVDYDTGEMKEMRSDQWYDKAIEWMVGKDASWDTLTEWAGRIPKGDHKLKDWPDARWDEAKQAVMQAQADAEAQAAEEAAAEADRPKDHEPENVQAQDYASTQQALNANFDKAWKTKGDDNLEGITDEQLNRMYAIAGDHGWSDAALNRLVKDELGWESKSDVPWGDPYDEICSALEDERLRYYMSRDPDTDDLFSEDEDAETEPNDEAFEEGAEDDSLPF